MIVMPVIAAFRAASKGFFRQKTQTGATSNAHITPLNGTRQILGPNIDDILLFTNFLTAGDLHFPITISNGVATLYRRYKTTKLEVNQHHGVCRKLVTVSIGQQKAPMRCTEEGFCDAATPVLFGERPICPTISRAMKHFASMPEPRAKTWHSFNEDALRHDL